jgi:hypothetical protein
MISEAGTRRKGILGRHSIVRSARKQQPTERPDPLLMTELDQLWDLDHIFAVQA